MQLQIPLGEWVVMKHRLAVAGNKVTPEAAQADRLLLIWRKQTGC
jgi:hypothetical protein